MMLLGKDSWAARQAINLLASLTSLLVIYSLGSPCADGHRPTSIVEKMRSDRTVVGRAKREKFKNSSRRAGESVGETGPLHADAFPEF